MSVSKSASQILSSMSNANEELMNQIYNLTTTPRKTTPRKCRKPSPKNVEVAEIAVTPVSSQPFDSYNDLVNDISVEQKLIEKGFTPIDRILIKDGNSYSAKYIHVATRNGQTAIVELDTDGYVATCDKDLIVVEADEALSVPYSVKQIGLDCVPKELAGVAYVCDDNICVLIRNDEFLPKETFFVSAEKAGKKEAVLDNSPIPHPVVRYSDILENAECVACNIEIASIALRKKAFEIAQLQLKESANALKHLNDSMVEFSRVQDNATNQLNTSIRQLEGLLKGYWNKCIIDANQEKYNSLLYNLRRRQQLADDLILTLGTSEYNKLKIEKLTLNIRQKTEYLRKEYCNLDKVLCE